MLRSDLIRHADRYHDCQRRYTFPVANGPHYITFVAIPVVYNWLFV